MSFSVLINLILSFLSLAFLSVDHYFLIAGNTTAAICYKTAASIMFVLVAIISMITCKEKSDAYKKYSIYIFAGLIFSLVADVFLELFFLAGVLFFMLTQICFLFALIKLCPTSKKAVIVSSAIFAVVAVTEILLENKFRIVLFNGFLILLLAYIAVLIFNTVKSFDIIKWNNFQSKTLPLALVFFLISDLTLQFVIFPNPEIFSKNFVNIMSIISNGFYYIAQLLIAFTLAKDFIKK